MVTDLAITWTNVDLSSGRSSDIHVIHILQEIPTIILLDNLVPSLNLVYVPCYNDNKDL